VSAGWATDLYVLEHSGSLIDDRGDHLVVRTPSNPDFHWGNCLFVTARESVDQTERWVRTFHETFPAATWIAIGLVRMPTDTSAWAEHGVTVVLDEVLTTGCLPDLTQLPDGYTVRRFAGDDWEQSVARELRQNSRTAVYEAVAHERFTRARAASYRGMTENNSAAFFGAFLDDLMVAELGIVCCGPIARYQAVSTDEDHRRRGLASHLLGVAARWAADQGCTRWVIVTEATNPAGRVYRRVGFEPDSGIAQAYRPPPR